MDFSRNLSQFFKLVTPSIYASLCVLALFFFAIFVASNSPAAKIAFTPRILAASNSSYFSSAITNYAQQASVLPENTSLATDVMLLKNISMDSTVERSGGSTERDIVTNYEELRSCNIFDGQWVVDNSYPRYSPGSCPFIDDAFNCIRNGRPDSSYQSLRWKPKGCNIPMLDGKEMLDMLRDKRLVFVGDSLNRNMWESLVCILRDSLENKTRAFEVSGKHEFRAEGLYAIRFVEWEMSASTGAQKETLRLDVIQNSSSKYRDADIIIFNTGHWWTHPKTSQGKNYYQEASYVYPELNVAQAYTKALKTWAKWVDANINANRTQVFFRGYSASHFRGGQWNSGGSCSGETQPITNDTFLAPYPQMMGILESVISKMATIVTYFNVTKMTDYRKDGHPSIFRHPSAKMAGERIQDCSHWCLPGVPDAWNELLYTSLLMSRN